MPFRSKSRYKAPLKESEKPENSDAMSAANNDGSVAKLPVAMPALENGSPPALKDAEGTSDFTTDAAVVNVEKESHAKEATDMGTTQGTVQVLAKAAEPEPEEDNEAVAELHAAALREDIQRIKLLLSRRHVPVDALNETGETAGICAARAGCAVACAALLDGHANPLARDISANYFSDGIWPDERTPDKMGKSKIPQPNALAGRTLIYHLRVAKCFDKVIAHVFPMTRVALVRAMADAIQRFHQKSALIVAARQGSVDLAAMLLTHSATSSALIAPAAEWGNQLNADGSPVIFGCERASERGTALLAACSNRHWRCAEVLLMAGVPRTSIDATRDSTGRGVIHITASACEANIMKMLLESGASTNVWSKFGRQPLHDACVVGNAQIVRLLLDGRADPTVRVKSPSGIQSTRNQDVGQTPHDIAAARSHGHVCAVLREYGVGESLEDESHNGSVKGGLPALCA